MSDSITTRLNQIFLSLEGEENTEKIAKIISGYIFSRIKCPKEIAVKLIEDLIAKHSITGSDYDYLQTLKKAINR